MSTSTRKQSLLRRLRAWDYDVDGSGLGVVAKPH